MRHSLSLDSLKSTFRRRINYRFDIDVVFKVHVPKIRIILEPFKRFCLFEMINSKQELTDIARTTASFGRVSRVGYSEAGMLGL